MTKISALTSVGDGLAVGDQFIIRDIDDAGTPNKSVTISGITRALQDGTVAAPALAFANDKNTGIYRPGDDQLAISTNGSQQVTVNSLGNVGIGVASPLARLDVRGSGPYMYIVDSGANSAAFVAEATNSVVNVGSTYLGTSAVPLALVTGGTERARIRSDGMFEVKGAGTAGSSPAFSVNGSAPANSMVLTSGGLVGIGTSGPAEKLSVNGNIDLPTINTFIKGGGHNVVQVDATRTYVYGGTNGVQIRTADNVSPLLDITNAGLVGIGTTSPQSLLNISTASVSGDQNVFICGTAATGVTGSHALYLGAYGSTQYGCKIKSIYNYAASVSTQLSFEISNAGTLTEAARIDSSGRLLVGTATQVGNVNGGILQLGSGITFPATAVAASDANTLDDYEEGTWTPALKVGGSDTGITYTERAGQYIKIGKLVYIRVGIFLGTHAGLTGNLTITTLPFTPQNVDGAEPFFRGASATGFGEFAAVVTSSSTTILLRNPTTFADLTDAVLAVGTRIYFTGCYPAA